MWRHTACSRRCGTDVAPAAHVRRHPAAAGQRSGKGRRLKAARVSLNTLAWEGDDGGVQEGRQGCHG